MSINVYLFILILMRGSVWMNGCNKQRQGNCAVLECVCVCVCERERERETESASVCVCVSQFSCFPVVYTYIEVYVQCRREDRMRES